MISDGVTANYIVDASQVIFIRDMATNPFNQYTKWISMVNTELSLMMENGSC